MRAGAVARTLRPMVVPASYAMFWSIGDGPRSAGRVEVGSESIALAATTPSAEVERIRFRDVGRVLLERGTLHVERTALPPVHIGSLDTPGALRELAERLWRVTPRSQGS